MRGSDERLHPSELTTGRAIPVSLLSNARKFMTSTVASTGAGLMVVARCCLLTGCRRMSALCSLCRRSRRAVFVCFTVADGSLHRPSSCSSSRALDGVPPGSSRGLSPALSRALQDHMGLPSSLLLGRPQAEAGED